MSDMPLVLSLFPGIGSDEAHFFGGGNVPMNHRVVIRAQDPYVISLTIRRTNRDSIARYSVVDIDDPFLATHLAAARNIGASLEEASNSTRPASVVRQLSTPPVFGVTIVERMSGTATSFLAACRRAIPTAPVVAIFSPEDRLTDAALPRQRWGDILVASQVRGAAQMRHLAGMFAEPLIALVRLVNGAALDARPGLVIGQTTTVFRHHSLLVEGHV